MVFLILNFFQYTEKKYADPTFSIFMGLGAVTLLGIGVYYAVKIGTKKRAANDRIWEEATTALGLIRSEDWSFGVKPMKGTIDGRDVVFSSLSVELKYSWTHRLYRYNLCRLSFNSPLGTAFGVIPKTANLWQNVGGNIPLHHATFNEHFKVWAEDKDFLTELLTTPLDEEGGPKLTDELADRADRQQQWVHFTESILEFGYRYKDRYDLKENDDLEAQLRKTFSEAVEFAARVERRVERLRQRTPSIHLQDQL
ncbi:MAG TPA: hypothetical protein PLP21_03145 [Pyrinomonadaceae bacterium]|nr:hypothetical protein [Acidobacteriota bacterium]HQZ95284.1 hypothetical protein [Pyrinomonadaceae bacterium]